MVVTLDSNKEEVIEIIDINECKINKEYLSYFPRMDRGAFLRFTHDIDIHGQQEAIIINSDGEILDGYNRHQALRVLRKPTIKVIRKSFPNKIEERLYVKKANLFRRHLTKFQQIELALKLLKPDLLKLAKMHESLGGKYKGKWRKGASNDAPLGSVNAALAEGISSKKTVDRVEYIPNKGSQELLEKARRDDIKIYKAFSLIQREERRAEQVANSKKLISAFLSDPEKYTVYEGDLEEASKNIKDSSIPLIVTDPPYSKKHLPEYAKLGRVADRILQDGGSLGVIMSHHFLFKAGNLIRGISEGDGKEVEGDKPLKRNRLNEWWPLGIKLKGPFQHYPIYGVSVKHKIIAWFVKGDRPINSSFPEGSKKAEYLIEDYKEFNDGFSAGISDLIESQTPDKTLDDWAQYEAESEHFITHFTNPNDVVCDPFLGKSTTAVAAMNTNRRFIGIDINPKRIEMARANPGFYPEYYKNKNKGKMRRNKELTEIREKEKQLHKMLRGKGKLKRLQ